MNEKQKQTIRELHDFLASLGPAIENIAAYNKLVNAFPEVVQERKNAEVVF